ncbi:Wbp4 [Symbiodinium microadriaticum]|nr:Wbp4 [Symbiodinium microadriaticum]
MKAEADRAEALEDVRVTEENMQATILASWKQGSDTNGRNYYYNFVTGESRLDPPENWTLKVTDAWIRNINERGQVYFYNQQTEESRWLPPCCCCGKEAERWCSECCAAYCVEDYVNIHNPETDEDMASHTWSAAELSKDVLKAGQVYCIECKKRAATKVCLTCWDNYCSECFKFVHHVGTFGTMRLSVTGETTFEKPRDLMTPSEMEYFDNFVSHRQNEVETLKYERDMRLANEIGGRGGGGIRRDKKVNDKGAKGGDDVMNSMKNAKRGPLAFLSGLSQAYTAKLMQPDDRKRGHKRSEYIKGLLEGQEEQK